MLKTHGQSLLILAVLFCNALSIAAQDTSVHSLPEFIFTEQKQKQLQQGFNTKATDSAVLAEYRSRNLADYLSEQSAVFIKSYGLGSLASISLRGSAASQTAVLWNGLNLQSSMNGQIDLALLPGFFTDRAELQYGSSSAAWGSGAVGGALVMNNNSLFGKGLITETGFSAGSFGNRQAMMKLGFGGRRYFIQSRVFGMEAENDFSFRNSSLPGSSELRQSNADMHQNGILTEAGFIPKLNNNIIIRHWHQAAHRGIPPTLSQTKSISFQDDRSERVTAEWNRSSSKFNSVLKAAWFDETIDFLTSDSSFNHNRAQSFITQAEVFIKLNKQFNLLFSALNNYSWAESSGFIGNPSQNRFAVFATLSTKLFAEKLKMQLILREELAGNKFVPFTPSFSTEYEFLKWLRLGANVSRTYRLPTFNDLFWNTGNPDVLPESGWNTEAFLAAEKKSNKWKLSASFNIYTRKIDNWIIWLPKVGFWTPQNVATVWSRGFELFARAGYEKKSWQFSVDGAFSYVRSTNIRAKTENDASVGKQLIYVPEFSAQGRAMLGYKTLRLSLSSTYTGYRFISTDNSDFLDSYILMRARLSWSTVLLSSGLDFFAESSNLGATEYQVIAQRPMPGRAYLAGIYINLSNLKTCCRKTKN